MQAEKINTTGDRNRLSRDELQRLDMDIIPTARRWMAIPGLDEHAKKTLAYWGQGAE